MREGETRLDTGSPPPPLPPKGGRRGDINRGDGDSWREAADQRDRANRGTRKNRANAKRQEDGDGGVELFLGGKDEDGGRERN